MSTQTMERTDDIEHLDFTPPCVCECHEELDQEVPPATHLCRFRGTGTEVMYCTPCTTRARLVHGDRLQVIPLNLK